MPAGFRTFDGDGNILVDLTSRISKVLGSILIQNDGDLVESEFNNGDPWYVCQYVKDLSGSGQYWPDVPIFAPTFSWVSNTKLKWNFASVFEGTKQFRLTYGIS